MQPLDGIGVAALLIYPLIFNRESLLIFFIILFYFFTLRYLVTPSVADKFTSVRRIMAISTWSDPSSPEAYGNLYFCSRKLLDKIQKCNKENEEGMELKIGHCVIKAFAIAMKNCSYKNAKILFGKLSPHDRNDISYLQIEPTLGFHCVRHCGEKPLLDISKEINRTLQEQKEGKNKLFNRFMLFCKLPDFFLSPFLSIVVGFISQTLGIGIFGIPGHCLGNIIITSIDLENAILPLPHYSRVSLLGAVCRPRKEVALNEGSRYEVRDMITIGWTVDTRYVLGYDVCQVGKEVKRLLEDVEELFQG